MLKLNPLVLEEGSTHTTKVVLECWSTAIFASLTFKETRLSATPHTSRRSLHFVSLYGGVAQHLIQIWLKNGIGRIFREPFLTVNNSWNVPDQYRLHSCEKARLWTLEYMAVLEDDDKEEENWTPLLLTVCPVLLLLCYVASTLIFNTDSPTNKRNDLLNICNVLIALTLDKLLIIFVQKEANFQISNFFL